MPVELKVPEVGESITEVEIGRWLKQEGDAVAKDDPIVEIETDKVTLELPAPAAGVITKQGKKQGEAASVGDVIGLMEEGDAPAAQPDAQEREAADAEPAKAEAQAPSEPAKAQRDAAAPAAHAPDAAEESGDRADANGPIIMPAARRLLEEHGLKAHEVEPTGPGGRLLKEDVQRHVDRLASKPPKAEGQPRTRTASAPAPAPAVSTEPGREEDAVPMSPMRRRIASRLVEAQQTAALLTTFNEIDMSAVMALRNQHKQAFADRYGIKLGFMSFFVKAAIDALKQFPAINAEVRDTTIVYKNYYDIGIAVGTGKGLVVPVLRSAERMSFAQVENTIAEFGQKVKENRLTLEEMQGGTFTITNGGVFGSLLSTPIVNPPQSAVLGMHAIQDRPVAIDGRVEVRPMMYVALTYDHRLVDGREAVSFLVRIKQALEDPARMLMEI